MREANIKEKGGSQQERKEKKNQIEKGERNKKGKFTMKNPNSILG